MKLPKNHPKKLRLSPRWLVFVCGWILISVPVIFYSQAELVLAQDSGIGPGETGSTNPKDRSTQVTATVAEFGTLESPSLTQPSNNSTSHENRPTFIWDDPATNSLATSYLFILNDTGVYELGTASQTTPDFYYEFNGGQTFSLRLRNGIPDGTYSWKIVSQDSNGNTADSAVWNFTIDTRPSDFVVERIENIATNLAAGNQHNIPSSPFEITTNDPEFKGVSDPGDFVEVTITLADGSTRTDSFSVSETGRWNRVFSNLPRGEIISFDFYIVDVVGNAIRLEDVLVYVLPPALVISLPPILTPPSIIPEPPIAVITIPLPPPPDEIVSRVIRELPPILVQPAVYLNATLRTSSPSVWLQIQRTIIEWLVLIFISLLTLAQAVSLATMWRHYLSQGLITSILMVIGILPDGKPQGICVTHPAQNPVSNALITISGQDIKKNHLHVNRITNNKGIFFDTPLPAGKYRVSIKHPSHIFPVLDKRPSHLGKHQFYTGSEIVVNDHGLPMLNIFANQTRASHVGTWLNFKLLRIKKISWPVWLIALIITVLFPTFGNLAVISLLTLAWTWKSWERNHISLDGEVLTQERKPISNVILCIDEPNGSPLEITQTNDSGLYQFHTKLDQYQLQATHVNYKVASKDRKQALATRISKDDHYHPVIMKQVK